MPRRRPAELHVNHERWLVSYADFITLLFAFFVVMYSISQVNESKYRVLSETLSEAFNPSRSVSTTRGSEQVILSDSGAFDLPATGQDIFSDEEGAGAGRGGFAQLDELSARFQERFSDLIGEDLLHIYSNEYWLQIELRDSILFSSGSADPSARAQVIFNEVAAILRDYDNPVQVEGFTDNLPINTPRFPSNWELSSARASTIVKWLANHGVAPERLSAVGYGEFQPVASNETEEGRAQNRRVALMIAREKVERPRTPVESSGQSLGGQSLRSPAAAPASGSPVSSSPVAAPAAQTGTTAAPTASGPEGEALGIQPIPLQGGGLLYSSDPDRHPDR